MRADQTTIRHFTRRSERDALRLLGLRSGAVGSHYTSLAAVRTSYPDVAAAVLEGRERGRGETDRVYSRMADASTCVWTFGATPSLGTIVEHRSDEHDDLYYLFGRAQLAGGQDCDAEQGGHLQVALSWGDVPVTNTTAMRADGPAVSSSWGDAIVAQTGRRD